MLAQDLKRWHWIAISLVVGLLLGYVQFQDPTDMLPKGTSSMAQTEFERSLIRTTADGVTPLLQDMKVYNAGGGEIRIVGRELTRRRGQPDQHQDFLFVAKTPYSPQIKPVDQSKPSGPYTVLDYMKDLQKKNKHIKYRGIWWTSKPVVLTMWTLGSLIVIGGIWPYVLNFLVGAGWGAKPPADPEYDLSKFSSAPEASKQAKVVSPEEIARLKALEEEMERNLAAGASPRVEGEVAAAQQPGEIRKLSGEKYDPGAAIDHPDEKKDYKGEFYPVAKQGNKPDQHQ